MKQKRTSFLHYEKRLNELNSYLKKELGKLQSFDLEYDEADNTRGFSAGAYFEGIKTQIGNSDFNSVEAFEDVFQSLNEYVPQMMRELQILGDEVFAEGVYEEWLELLTDKKASPEQLTHVVRTHGGDMIRDTHQRHQYGVSWEVFVKSIDVLVRQFRSEDIDKIDTPAAKNIEAFIMEHGASSLLLCATTTSNGLGTNLVDREYPDDVCQLYYSYATEAMDCYYDALELMGKAGSPHNNVRFVHQIYEPMADVLSHCLERRHYSDEKKTVTAADTLNQYNCLFYSLQTLKKHAPLNVFYDDVHRFVPDPLDSFRKNGDSFLCVDILEKTIGWLDHADKERHGFVETICTREAANLIKAGFHVNACDVVSAMKDAFELPRAVMFVLTDPQQEKPTPLAAMAGRFSGAKDNEFDEDYVAIMQVNQKTLLRDSSEAGNVFLPVKDITTDAAFRVSDFEKEVMKIPMYIGTKEARPLCNHLYMYVP